MPLKEQTSEIDRSVEDFGMAKHLKSIDLYETSLTDPLLQDTEFIADSTGLLLPYDHLVPGWVEETRVYAEELRASVEYRASEIGVRAGAIAAVLVGAHALDHIGENFSVPDFTALNPLNLDTVHAASLDQQGVPVGGKGFGISSESTGVNTSWQDGDVERGYNLIRLSASGVTTFPRSGMISGVSAAYALTEPSSDPASCYMLIPLGENNTPLGQSDLLCAIRGSLTPTGSPVGFTIRLNQGNTASLTWREPGGQDGYFLFPLGGEPIPLPGNTTQFNLDTGGNLKCVVLAAMRSGSLYGLTDILCGLPGFSRFPTILVPTPTLTVIRATETPTIILPSATPTLEPTRTPTITPTRQPTPTLHPYYSQFQFITQDGVDGRIVIQANSSVDSRTLQEAKNITSDATSRPDLRRALIDKSYSVSIFGEREVISSLPRFSSEFYLNNPSLAVAIEWNGGNPILAIREDYLIYPERYYPAGYKPFAHETSHVIESYGLPIAERQQWLFIVNRLNLRPEFPGNWRDILYYPDNPNTPIDELATEGEFFAEVSRARLAGLIDQIRAKDSGVATFIQNVYPLR